MDTETPRAMQLTLALNMLRDLFPDQPVMVIVVFEADDGYEVCSGGNMELEQQKRFLCELVNSKTSIITSPTLN